MFNGNEGRMNFLSEITKLLTKMIEDLVSKQETFLCLTISTWIQETTRLPTKCEEGNLCQGVKQSDCQAGHSPGGSECESCPTYSPTPTYFSISSQERI